MSASEIVSCPACGQNNLIRFDTLTNHHRAICHKCRTHLAPLTYHDYVRQLWAEACHCADAGRSEDAVKILRQIVSATPEDADAFRILGEAYCKLGNYVASVNALKEATRLCPSDPIAHYHLGAADYELGNYADAVSAFEQAIHFRPDHGPAYTCLGAAHYELKEYSKAVENFRQATRLRPDERFGYKGLALSLCKMGDYRAAEEACISAISIEPDDTLDDTLAFVQWQLGRRCELSEDQKISIYRDLLGELDNPLGAIPPALRHKLAEAKSDPLDGLAKMQRILEESKSQRREQVIATVAARHSLRPNEARLILREGDERGWPKSGYIPV